MFPTLKMYLKGAVIRWTIAFDRSYISRFAQRLLFANRGAANTARSGGKLEKIGVGSESEL